MEMRRRGWMGRRTKLALGVVVAASALAVPLVVQGQGYVQPPSFVPQIREMGDALDRTVDRMIEIRWQELVLSGKSVRRSKPAS
ncbi:MAG: hypothetical protein JXA69_18545 [Phycisphaerae bacterium]|nr:hypothetical protein [Phycisphaerae bacterium]